MALLVSICWSRMVTGGGGSHVCAIPFLLILGADGPALSPVCFTTGNRYQPHKQGHSDQVHWSHSKCLGRSFVVQFHIWNVRNTLTPWPLISNRLVGSNYTIAQLLAIARAFNAAACFGAEKPE